MSARATAASLRLVLPCVVAPPLAARAQPSPATSPATSAPAHGAHGEQPPRGPHDATARHAFDDVAHWTRVFDDPARDGWQKPREVVAALALAPGATVADLGAGTGYFVPHLAAAVGPGGTVLAADTELALVGHLRGRAEQDGLGNVVPILASTDNPRLPARAADVILIVDTYHHIDDRVAYAGRLGDALAPSGRVAIVDWQKRDLPLGPPLGHKLAREQVIAEMTRAGYALVGEPDILPYQYFLIFAVTRR
jgi:predicted methyltransferase